MAGFPAEIVAGDMRDRELIVGHLDKVQSLGSQSFFVHSTADRSKDFLQLGRPIFGIGIIHNGLSKADAND